MSRSLVRWLVALPLLVPAVQQDRALELGKDLFGRDVPFKGDPYAPLQGLWQLVDIDDPEMRRASRQHQGYLLIHGRYLALELHVQWSDARYRGVLFFRRGRWDPGDIYQSGIRSFELDQLGNLRTSALVGAFLNERDELEWEDVGDTQEYRVEVTDNTLTLYLIDGARYDFARHRSAVSAQQRFFGSPSPGERDIFGRQHTEPSEGTEGTDIFGRDTSGATPDIFGRSRQDPPVSGDDDDEPEGGGGDGGGDGPP